MSLVVRVSSATALVLTLFLWASPASAVAGPADPSALVFQSVVCQEWEAVPGNVVTNAQFDDTNGGYLRWTSREGSDLVAYTEDTLPDGCALIGGAQFNITTSPGGSGAERLLAVTEPGVGSVSLPVATLGPDDVSRLTSVEAAGGLWIRGRPSVGEFANMRCRNDATNSDSLEVIRLSDRTSATCQLFSVVAGLSMPIPPVDSPTVDRPAVDKPTIDKPTIDKLVAIPTVAQEPTAVPPALSPQPTSIAQVPSNPRGEREPVVTAPSIDVRPAASRPAVEELALGRATSGSLSVAVEVGGLTRGVPDNWAGVMSPWTRPVIIEVQCPGRRSEFVKIHQGEVPGYQASSAPVVIGSGSGSCLVEVLEDGVDGSITEVTAHVDGIPVVEGVPVDIGRTDDGRDRVVKMQLTYGPAREAPQAVLPASNAVLPDQRIPVPVSAAFGGVFILGLALAFQRSRRTA